MENLFSSTSTTFRPRKSIFSKPKPDQTPRLALNGQFIDFSYNQCKNSSKSNVQQQFRQSRQTQTCPSFYIAKPSQNIAMNSNSRILYQSTIRPQSVGGKSITFNKSNSNLYHSVCPRVINHQRIISHSPTRFEQHKIIREFSKPYQRVINMEQKPLVRCVVSPQYSQVTPIQHIHQIQPIQQIKVIQTVQDQNILHQVNKLNSMNQVLITKYSQVSNQLENIKQRTHQKEFVEDSEFLQKTLNKIDQIFIKETNIALNKMTDMYLEKKSVLKKVFKKIDMNSRANQMSRVNLNQNNSCISGISCHSKDNSPSKLSVFQKLKF